ncbi:hypothetical protein AB9P05_24065 [Roseivirga sp. BDSF3-8]|uniref:hypothetical protein n=1 Tax=Roseivirga sp. BDSF3-8 TaxID=3241598 RepID=UPI003531CA39
MTSVVTLALLGGLLPPAFAQDDAFYDKLAEETCQCLDKKPLESMSSVDLKYTIAECMNLALEPHMKKLEEMSEVPPQIGEMGKQVATRLLLDCPAYQQRMGHIKSEREIPRPESYPEEEEVEGTIQYLEAGRFYKLTLLDNRGKRYTFVILHDFKNSEDLLQAEAKKLEGTKVRVSYYSQELYRADMNEYIPARIITEINFD